MPATEQIASISGALMSQDHPVWVPHQTVTETQAVAAIIHHMKGDALEHFDEATGPVHWDEGSKFWEASGNFFLCSAGFHIAPISDDGRAFLLEAWEIHRASRHFAIAQQLHALGRQVKEAESSVPRQRGAVPNERLMSEARAPFLRVIKPLEAELENILSANRSTSRP